MIRLRQTTQKDQQASAASFGLGLDHGDGGTRAVQGALGQVANATSQIARNLEQKDAAVQKGNADRKMRKASEQFRKYQEKSDLLLATKDYEALRQHEDQGKLQWGDNFDINSELYSSDGDVSVRQEYADEASSFFRESYGKSVHANRLASLAGQLANEAESALGSSAATLSDDISKDRVSWATGAFVTTDLNRYFSSPAFEDSNPLSQEIYKKQGFQQMAGYVDAMVAKQRRNPNSTKAQHELNVAQEQVRSAEWLTVDQQNHLLSPLSSNIGKISKGANVNEAKNTLTHNADAASASGVSTTTLEENLAIVDAALAVVSQGSADYDTLTSQRETALVQDRMMDTDVREAIWEAYGEDRNFALKDIELLKDFDFGKVKKTNMTQLNSMKDAIIDVRDNAESKHGYLAGALTMTPRSGKLFESSSWSAKMLVEEIHEGGARPENIELLQKDARGLKFTAGEHVDGGLPTETVSGKAMIAFLPEALSIVEEEPTKLGSAVAMLIAGNEGVFDVAQWAATTGDTDNPDIDVIKAALSVAHHAPVGVDVTAILNMALSEDPLTQWPDGTNKNLWREYQSMVADGRVQPVGADQQVFQQRSGLWSSSMFWSEFGKASLAHSIKENPDMSIYEHLSNAENITSSIANIYTGSSGQQIMLFAETEKSMRGGDVRIGSPLSTFLKDMGNYIMDDNMYDPVGALDPNMTVSTKGAENITQAEAVDLIHLSAHKTVLEKHPDLLDNYFTGLSSKAAGNPEMLEAIDDLREKYPPFKMFEMLRLGSEQYDEKSGEFVVPFLLPAWGAKGFKSGWDTVKLDDGTSLTVPVSKLIQDVRSSETGQALRDWEAEQRNATFIPRVIHPIKRGAKRVYDKTLGTGPKMKAIEGAINTFKDSY